jgi:hypothetical protein
MSSSERPRPYQPAKISIDDYERLTRMFKDLFAEQPLIKWSIYFAGIAGVCETIDFIWKLFKHFKP